MLSTLDIVIGFAVIMTVLSLLITILVQMVSTGLALRGKNLANALSLTFQTIDPKIGEHAHSLAAQILRDPIFSDSIWRKKSRVVGAATEVFLEVERKIALEAQFAQAKSGAIGNEQVTNQPGEGGAPVPQSTDDLGKLADLVKAERELKEALKEWAKAGDAKTKKEARETVVTATGKVDRAKAIAPVLDVKANRTKPWGFWTWPSGGARQLGNAIRPGEIYRVLHELAELTETEAALKNIPSDLVTKASMLVATLAKRDRPTTEAQQKLGWLNSVSQVFEGAKEQQLAVVNALPDLAATVERATTQAYDRFQRWFGSGQDRAEQWFQTHMRVVTVVMAVLTAFLLQLDTVDIYRQLRDQPALTAALVKAAPGVIEQGGVVLDPVNTGGYHTYLLWLQKHPLFPLKALPDKGTDAAYSQAVADRIKAGPDSEYPLQQFDKAFQAANTLPGLSESAVAKAAYDAWVKNFPTLKLNATLDDAATQDTVHKAIKARIAADPDAKPAPDATTPPGATAAPDEKRAKQLLADFDALQPDGKLAFEAAQQNAFRDLKKQMDTAGFNLAPVPFLGRWDGEKLSGWVTRIRPPVVGHYFVHIIGVLMTAGLLTLGAPFWFNLLKNLTSLRPALAALVEKRPTSSPALPQTPATPGTS